MDKTMLLSRLNRYFTEVEKKTKQQQQQKKTVQPKSLLKVFINTLGKQICWSRGCDLVI